MIEILRYGFKYIFNYKRLYCAYFISQMGMNVTGLFIPVIEGKIIDLFVNFNGTNFKWYIFLLIIDMILSLCFSSLSSYLYFKLQSLCGNQSNLDEIEHLYSISYMHLLDNDPSVLNQSLNNDCNNILIFCLSSLQKVIMAILSMAFIVFVIFQYSIQFIWLISLSILLYFCVYFFFKDKVYEANKNTLNKGSVFFGALYQLIYYLKSIKMCSLFQQSKRFEETTFNDFYNSAKKQTILECGNDFVSNTISLLTQALLYIFGAYLILNQQLTIGTLIVVANYYSNLLTNAQVLLDFGNDVQKCKASYDRLSQLSQIKNNFKGKEIVKKIEYIRVKDVSFKYPNGDALFCVNHKFLKGNIYQIQGVNGSGKSTFVQVLTGIFGEDYKGEIFIDDHNIKKLDIKDFLYKYVSVCTQEPLITEDTVEHNLTLNEDFDREGLNKLLKGFHLEELTYQMNQVLHPLNLSLSSGQRQKIGIIRTLLSNREVLIFDEPTSALDAQGKLYFQYCLKNIHDKIILLITHDHLEELDIEVVAL